MREEIRIYVNPLYSKGNDMIYPSPRTMRKLGMMSVGRLASFGLKSWSRQQLSLEVGGGWVGGEGAKVC